MTGTTRIETAARGGGLAEKLRACLEGWSRRTGITVETWALPPGDVPPAARAVLAGLRESLAMAERRGGVAVVAVAVTAGAGGLRMTVSDDGPGLPEEAAGTGGRAMRAAFAAAGGTVAVHGVPGEGTTVTGVVRWSGRPGPGR
ncbi:hypothetical protein MF672_035615 [Actinomadura sp. ATCC 31491]|uniref:Histidine kinase/HSP90-like ATPase domain-containing protein n=1 Tax=Actinomadura luzonensis TaxID=2805427 RepID=A0ABT0G3A8_9ACTN|nr:hypothetical protein [Actinomadura luzonensis]MCK2219086.1 hypothetical protein [Actinomadura luzonensis]